MPYVYVGPEPTTVMHMGDSLYVFSHPDLLSEVLMEFKSSRNTSRILLASSESSAIDKKKGGGADATRNILHEDSDTHLYNL